MATKSDASMILARHIGRANGISGKELARQLGVPERRMRHLVEELCDDGVAVGGTPGTGYYIAETEQELTETCEFLYSRVKRSLSRIAKYKKVAMPELRGQLRLKT